MGGSDDGSDGGVGGDGPDENESARSLRVFGWVSTFYFYLATEKSAMHFWSRISFTDVEMNP